LQLLLRPTAGSDPTGDVSGRSGVVVLSPPQPLKDEKIVDAEVGGLDSSHMKNIGGFVADNTAIDEKLLLFLVVPITK
jgi:hypothetical protein